MDSSVIRQHLPTLASLIAKRQKATQNRLPKHLRPMPIWPIWLQLALNAGILFTLFTIMINKDDYLTEAGPAVTMVICLMFLIYTFISANQLKHRYVQVRGAKLVRANFWLMVAAVLAWPICVAVYLP